MKQLFIPAKSRTKEPSISNLEKLPKEIALLYSIQFKEQAEKIKSQLKTKKITLFQQVLGCSKPKIPKNTKALLLIGSGKFHATSLALETDLPVYVFENNQLKKVSEEEIANLKKIQKTAYLKYLHSEKVGILVSTKPGQEKLKQAINISNKIKDKKTYLFLSNNVSVQEFNNFPEINSYINSACPRLEFDNPKIINLSKLNI